MSASGAGLLTLENEPDPMDRIIFRRQKHASVSGKVQPGVAVIFHIHPWHSLDFLIYFPIFILSLLSLFLFFQFYPIRPMQAALMAFISTSASLVSFISSLFSGIAATFASTTSYFVVSQWPPVPSFSLSLFSISAKCPHPQPPKSKIKQNSCKNSKAFVLVNILFLHHHVINIKLACYAFASHIY